MESMQTTKRQFKLDIKSENIAEVLKLLREKCGSGNIHNITIKVSLDDMKETYKILNSDQGIIDWDFLDQPKELIEKIDTTIEESKKETVETKKDTVKEIEKEEEKYFFPDSSWIGSTDDLIKVIEAIWHISKNRPGLRFGTSLFYKQFQEEYTKINEEEYLKTDLNKSVTRAMMKLLIDVYYNSPVTRDELDIAYNDTIKNIEQSFNSLKNAETLNQVMNILYRHECKKI